MRTPDDAKKNVKSLHDFDAFSLTDRDAAPSWLLSAIFEGKYSGLHLPCALANPDKLAAVWRANTMDAVNKQYAGTAIDLAASGGPSHWEPAYPKGNSPEVWATYFDETQRWDEYHRKVFAAVPWVQETLIGPVVAAFGPDKVHRLKHPRYGRHMNAFIVRTGYAARHVDHGGWDLAMDIVGHAGAVLVLDSAPDTVQRVYRERPSRPAYSGTYEGNYGLEKPDPDVEYVDVESVAGSWNLVSAQHIHEVVSVLRNRERLTVACHFVMARDGHVYYYA